MEVKLEVVKVDVPEGVNVILGHSHFIKTVEDLHEVLVNSVPGIKFGLAFNEASGPCLVRASGRGYELAIPLFKGGDKRLLTEADVDVRHLPGLTLAVLGYGNQGRAQALNLRDSGVEVVVAAAARSAFSHCNCPEVKLS